MCFEFGCTKYKNEIEFLSDQLSETIELLDQCQLCNHQLRDELEQCQAVIPAPNYLDDIDYAEIYSLLQSEFPSASLHLADRDFKTTSKTEMMRFLSKDLTDVREYVTEYYDCDDFSYALMGAISNPEWGALPFAIVWTDIYKTDAKKELIGRHAVNCFIDKKRQVWIIEPQNDTIMECPKNWTPYFVVM